MATTTLTHTCKHTAAHDLSDRSEQDRDRYVKWLVKNKCPECRSKAWRRNSDKERGRELQSKYQAALNDSAAMGLSDLTGSPSQIS
ncbi:hypothetical protein ACFRJ9_21700 [Paenarthrobacter sp. NPDC056912]|uniref:hypothetical protein n=1 Tax=Paenarthrobacter sp. NPDC056912 TaxID=3345965 RepID=UPI0036714D07